MTGVIIEPPTKALIKVGPRKGQIAPITDRYGAVIELGISGALYFYFEDEVELMPEVRH